MYKIKRGRLSSSGRLCTIAHAKANPDTTTIDTFKIRKRRSKKCRK